MVNLGAQLSQCNKQPLQTFRAGIADRLPLVALLAGSLLVGGAGWYLARSVLDLHVAVSLAATVAAVLVVGATGILVRDGGTDTVVRDSVPPSCR